MNTTTPRHLPARLRSRWSWLVAGALAVTTVAVVPGTGNVVHALDDVVFDDMEHGDPFGNGWFAFGGSVGGGGIDANMVDLPPNDGGVASLQTGWGSGGNPGWFGGFGRANQTDLTGASHFNFWINPDAGQDYTLEINLQEDDNGDDAITAADDDEFQYNCVVSPVGPCAIAGGGWQLVSLRLTDFVDDNSFITGGNGELDATSVANGGNGGLANIVVAVIGNSGSDATFRTDHWTFGDAGIVDTFENGLPAATSSTGELLGFSTFQGDGSVSISTEPAPPAPELPDVGSPNTVMRMDVDVSTYAGFIHAFENATVDAWITRNWSRSEGIRFWMYGTNSGTTMFVDLLDNRNPGSTRDDAERYTEPFVDDFEGWKLIEFPFASFTRKEIGNGAPGDGLGLSEIHGYAIGTDGTNGARTFYFDQIEVYGIAEPPALAVNLSKLNTLVEEGQTAQVGVRLNRALGPDDPSQVSIDYATERSYATTGEEFTPTSGTLTFVNGGPTELFFAVETFDDTKFEGDEQIVVRLTNPVGVERGNLFQGSVLIDDDDPFDPKLLDDFERGAYFWDTEGPATIGAVRTDDRPGQDAVEHVGVASVPLTVDINVGRVCNSGKGVVPVELLSSTTFDATTVDVSTVRLGAAMETHVDKKTGKPQRHVEDVNGDGLDDLVLHFRFRDTGLPCDPDVIPFGGTTDAGKPFVGGDVDSVLVHDFPLGQDWTGTQSLDFWYHGAGGGEEIAVTLKDNRAADPGPSGWTLAWADEFDGAAGTTPDPANWAYEIGDTTPDGKNGWGNEELQYYTDDADNAATDGNGNLVITLDEADPGQECYYGPCEFESARLITQHKAEFAYGRVESRLKVPSGGDGLWPAFWSLGTDITYNPWPGAGEIDIMEYVSRIPNEIFGTVHGPGYSGGQSIGDTYDFGTARVDEEFHTYAVEWQPNLIVWYIDGIEYHRVTPADLPGPWVFDKPFFLLLNFAIGGNFGGAIDPANTYPQEYLVDYVRVFQGPDTAERFETTFVDDTVGWRQVSIPVADFARSADQPAGAPDDGLTLSEVWGFGFEFPEGTASGEASFDLVRRTPVPPPTELVVTNLDDAGDGSLRDAIGRIADGGTITFDPSLAGGTVRLTSGELVVDRSVTIDASEAPGLVLSGDGVSRVLRVAAAAAVTANDLVIADGVGLLQGGGVYNLGTLHLERVVVRDNAVPNTAATFFENGGGGIYSGAGSTLTLTDSVVSDNEAANQPGGGIYGFFGSSITVTRSTISGNVSGDVAGGLRTLGTLAIVNSTISGNVSSAWHGGGLFVTDGAVTVSHSTIVGNQAPGGTAGGLMVASFGAPVTVTLVGNLIADNGSYNCQIEGGAAAVLTSTGGNLVTDASCAAMAGDRIVAPGEAGYGPLSDNGGPTPTHPLLPSGPAVDMALAGVCPGTDQRGIARPQGVACDAGAFELVN